MTKASSLPTTSSNQPNLQEPSGLASLPIARWPWETSLQLRIVLTYALMFTIVLGLLTWGTGQISYNSQTEQAEHELEVKAFLTANALEDAQSGFISEFDNHIRFLNSMMREQNFFQGTWVVGDQTFVVDEQTKLEEENGSFALGGCAKVEMRHTSSGDVATEVESSTCDSDDLDELIISFPDSDRLLIIDEVSLRQDAPSLPRLQRFVTSYAKETDTRVTIMDSWANVIADSHYPRHELNNQLTQIEIQAALQDGEQHHVRPDPVDGAATLYVAAPIHQNGRILGIVQLSQPLALVTAGSRNLLLGLISASLAALLVTIGVGTLISRRLVQPVRRLEEAAISLAEGDMSQRVPMDRADELGALGGAFNYMASKMANTFEQQRLFIANASHELRTPLANIQLRSDALLRSSDDPETTKRYLSEISAETQRMGKLTFDLLDLARLESANEDSCLGRVASTDLLPHLHSLCETMMLRAESVNLTWIATLPDELPPLRIKISDLETVVCNLLDNAIKYTPAGGTLALSMKIVSSLSGSSNKQVCQIRVEDTGLGISCEDLPHIFDHFYRVDKARTRRSDAQDGSGTGFGLGLALVQAIVSANHGQVFVDSVEGQGSVFTVEIPGD